MARSMWALLSEEMVEVVINIQEPDARGWLAAVIGSLPLVEVTRMVVALWDIWHAR
jgi:hypothetical protein